MIYDKNAVAGDISRAEERTTLETTAMTLQSFISRCTIKMNECFGYQIRNTLFAINIILV